MNFSVVIPIKNDEYIEKNLPSWCQLQPDELILCFDKPVPEESVLLVDRIVERHKVNHRILVVQKNSDYRFHQAWVRRKGFLAARNDVILTGDMDLQVYPSCLKAVSMVGKNDVGLVSLMKIRVPKGLQGKIRGFMDKHGRRFALRIDRILTLYYLKLAPKKQKAYFTGLYATWRPYWLDSEDKDIARLGNPKTAPYVPNEWGGYQGEDTFLKNCMEKKHKCIYLFDVGAKDFGVGLEETKTIQLKIGKYHALEAERPNYVVKASIIHVRPTMLGSYMHHLAIIYGGTLRAYVQTMKDIIYPWLYRATRALLHIFLRKDKRDKVLNIYGFRQRFQNGIQPSIEKLVASTKEELENEWFTEMA